MDDRTIQRKLNQITKLANELDAEAKKRWPHSDAGLFFEADGGLHMMSGDVNGGALGRQEFIEFTSNTHCAMGAGAW